jgi:hypothetical protein
MPADAVTVTCTVSPCVIVHQISIPPFDLSIADGSLIAGSIVAVWAIALVFRQVARLINDGNSTSERET